MERFRTTSEPLLPSHAASSKSLASPLPEMALNDPNHPIMPALYSNHVPTYLSAHILPLFLALHPMDYGNFTSNDPFNRMPGFSMMYPQFLSYAYLMPQPFCRDGISSFHSHLAPVNESFLENETRPFSLSCSKVSPISREGDGLHAKSVSTNESSNSQLENESGGVNEQKSTLCVTDDAVPSLDGTIKGKGNLKSYHDIDNIPVRENHVLEECLAGENGGFEDDAKKYVMNQR